MRLRDFSKMYGPNDGSRTLLESTVAPELQVALRDWRKAGVGGVVIGGIGLSYHARPRATQDIDLLFLVDDDIPDEVPGFKKSRRHAFTHNRTHVEVEIVTASHVNVPVAVFSKVAETAVESDGVKVASAAGLIALKLFRASAQDKADIIALIKSRGVRLEDMSTYSLPQPQLQIFKQLLKDAADDPHPV